MKANGGDSKFTKIAQRQAQMGLGDEVEIWPENWQSVNFFMDYCRTQWRIGMGGATGLDYTAVLACLRTLRLGRKRAEEVFADVRVIEAAALEAILTK